MGALACSGLGKRSKKSSQFFGMSGSILDMKQVALFCSLLLFSAVASGAEKHLFILSGQSNMAGMNPELGFTPAVSEAFGAENVVVVKNAKGGQPIRQWFILDKAEAGEDPTGPLYGKLMEAVKAEAEGKEFASVSFFWMQGERDAKESLSSKYRASLEGLVGQIEKDLGIEGMNVVIGRLSDNGGSKEGEIPEWKTMREIQVAIADSKANYDWIDTDDLNDGMRKGKMVKNDLHMTDEGYKLMGQRFAKKAIVLIKGE